MAIETAAQAWFKAFNAHDVEGLAALSTSDIIVLDANKAARDAWARAFVATRGHVRSVSKEIEITGDIAWRMSALVVRRPNGDEETRGQSLEIWKRVKSEWKLHRQLAPGLLAPQDLFQRPDPKKPHLNAPKN